MGFRSYLCTYVVWTSICAQRLSWSPKHQGASKQSIQWRGGSTKRSYATELLKADEHDYCALASHRFEAICPSLRCFTEGSSNLCRDVRPVHAAPVEPTCLLQEACDVTGGTPSLRIMFLFDKKPPVLDSIIIQSDVPAVD